MAADPTTTLQQLEKNLRQQADLRGICHYHAEADAGAAEQAAFRSRMAATEVNWGRKRSSSIDEPVGPKGESVGCEPPSPRSSISSATSSDVVTFGPGLGYVAGDTSPFLAPAHLWKPQRSRFFP